MKIKLLAILILFNAAAFAQNIVKDEFAKEIKSVNAKLKTLQAQNQRLESDLKSVNSKLKKAALKVDSLNKQLIITSSAIKQTNIELEGKIQETGRKSEAQVSAVDRSLSKNSLLGIIGTLLLVLLSGALYWLLSKKQKIDKSEMIEQLSKTKSSIEESLIGEFTKQTNLMDSELQLLAVQKADTIQQPEKEVDHSLALKVASEINLIERNVSLMDKGIKGLKQLERSVGKLKDNLIANGYEVPELLGKHYDQGMKVIVASSIPNEDLGTNSEIITKILIPQVNYHGIMIQTAQIEVSVGI